MKKSKSEILPNFLIVGSGKSGTTSLHYYLNRHPEIFMCEPKEPHFFLGQIRPIPQAGVGDDRKKVYQNLHEYRGLFKRAVRKKAIGDASVSNLIYAEEVIPIIKQYLGDPKIIIMLRNPVDRAFSAYLNLVLQGREKLSFEEALAEEEGRIKANWRHTWFFRTNGFYFKRVKAYMENFSDVEIHLFDELKTSPATLIKALCDFLGVDPSFDSHAGVRLSVTGLPWNLLFGWLMQPSKFRHQLTRFCKILLTQKVWFNLRDKLRDRMLYRPEMKPETKRMLCDQYREDLLKLQTLIKKDLSSWLETSNKPKSE